MTEGIFHDRIKESFQKGTNRRTVYCGENVYNDLYPIVEKNYKKNDDGSYRIFSGYVKIVLINDARPSHFEIIDEG